jgi:type II secretory pathway pseudopilin PulG
MFSNQGSHGFTVIELLIALTIVMLISGALASVVTPARAAFDRVPAELDLQQRGRTAIEVLSQAIRSAISIADPGAAGGALATLTVITPVAAGARGVTDTNQSGTSMVLATTPCPNVKDVCGFTPGAAAVITDGDGQYDVFIVTSTIPGARQLSSDRSLSHAYPAGSTVVEIEQSTFSLSSQADGSLSLIRETAAGAIQPIVDFVSKLSFIVSGGQVDIALSVGAPTDSLRRVVAERVFRTSIKLRNVS